MVGIYKIQNTVNGKIYVGQSKDIEDRWTHHKYNLRNGKHANYLLQEDWYIFGENNFRFSVIEECKEHELINKEQEWILSLGTYEYGYNLTLGGEGNIVEHPMLQFTLKGEFVKEWENGYKIVIGQKTTSKENKFMYFLRSIYYHMIKMD